MGDGNAVTFIGINQNAGRNKTRLMLLFLPFRSITAISNYWTAMASDGINKARAHHFFFAILKVSAIKSITENLPLQYWANHPKMQ